MLLNFENKINRKYMYMIVTTQIINIFYSDNGQYLHTRQRLTTIHTITNIPPDFT